MSRIIKKIQERIARTSSARYCTYLRKKGVHIGQGTVLRPKTSNIDITRPSLVSIGDNCYLNEGFTLLTHDWVTQVFVNKGYDFINSSGKVTIGNNVSFGQNVMVLKGVTIGDDCFIGAGSIVTRDIPANSLAVGAPCKVVMTIDDYYQKRLTRSESEAMEYARSIQERFGRKPVPADFWEEFVFFVDGDRVNDYPEIPIRRQLGPVFQKYVLTHKAKYSDFEAFLKAAGIE